MLKYLDIERIKRSAKLIKPVDLGLSVLWADRNLGAKNPDEVGVYIGWGATGYKTYNGEKFDIPLEYDIANFCLGGNWRMPTVNEIRELLRNVDIHESFITGRARNSIELTNKKGLKLIAPVSGYLDHRSKIEHDVKNGATFWTSETSHPNSTSALFGRISVHSCSELCIYSALRTYKMQIRPVMDKK